MENDTFRNLQVRSAVMDRWTVNPCFHLRFQTHNRLSEWSRIKYKTVRSGPLFSLFCAPFGWDYLSQLLWPLRIQLLSICVDQILMLAFRFGHPAGSEPNWGRKKSSSCECIDERHWHLCRCFMAVSLFAHSTDKYNFVSNFSISNVWIYCVCMLCCHGLAPCNAILYK